MGRQSAAEVRKEVLDEDSTKDVSIYLSVPVGVIAGVSALGALCAVIAMRSLVYFRQGVDAYWLSCVPFLFPVITGLFAAYKKQFSLFGVHLAVTLLALLMGGLGFGLSVDPIFLKRHDCAAVTSGVRCDKDSLAFLYLVAGGVAAGFAVLGFLMTICALNSAMKRMAKRRYQAELEHLRQQEEKQRQIHHMKTNNDVKPRTFSTSSSLTSHNTASNNIPQTQENHAKADSKGESDVTTKL